MDLRHWIWGRRRRRDHNKTIQFKLYSLLFIWHSSSPAEHSQIQVFSMSHTATGQSIPQLVPKTLRMQKHLSVSCKNKLTPTHSTCGPQCNRYLIHSDIWRVFITPGKMFLNLSLLQLNYPQNKLFPHITGDDSFHKVDIYGNLNQYARGQLSR